MRVARRRLPIACFLRDIEAGATGVIQYEAHVRGAINFERAIEEQLQQHILLRMTAAELMHTPKYRTHQRKRLPIVAAPVRRDRRADRQRDRADDAVHGSGAFPEGSHRFDEPPRNGEAQSPSAVTATPVSIDRPVLALNLTPEAVTGLEFGSARDVLDRVPGLDERTASLRQEMADRRLHGRGSRK